jgi:regulator of sigma E protease
MIGIILIALFSIIGLLVLHELGHFLVAKRFGVRVEEFGVGYPPRLFGKKVGDTVYSLNLLPFGAFVKIPGEGGEKSSLEDYRRFAGKPAWQRALILFGGVASFWIVAAILLSIVFVMGTPQAISDEEVGPLVNPKVQILAVAPDSPAELAGVKTGDAILELKADNEQMEVDKVAEVQDFTERHKGEEVILTVIRSKETFEMSLVPRVLPPEGEGAIGVALVRTADKSYPWYQAPLKGIEATFNLTVAVISGWAKVLGSLIQGEGMPAGVQMVGPVGIGSLLTKAAQVGLSYFLQFIAIISIYLAVFNILPIPALDGGKLVFLGIEKLRGRPVNQNIEQKITATFFFLLLSLIIWVTIKDIINLF